VNCSNTMNGTMPSRLPCEVLLPPASPFCSAKIQN
jgi:hypothetical protein